MPRTKLPVRTREELLDLSIVDVQKEARFLANMWLAWLTDQGLTTMRQLTEMTADAFLGQCDSTALAQGISYWLLQLYGLHFKDEPANWKQRKWPKYTISKRRWRPRQGNGAAGTMSAAADTADEPADSGAPDDELALEDGRVHDPNELTEGEPNMHDPLFFPQVSWTPRERTRRDLERAPDSENGGEVEDLFYSGPSAIQHTLRGYRTLAGFVSRTTLLSERQRTYLVAFLRTNGEEERRYEAVANQFHVSNKVAKNVIAGAMIRLQAAYKTR